jgi:mannose-6-phosphate isomerase-like protein (cupin superfamily)
MNEASPISELLQKAAELSGVYENAVLARCNDHVVRISRMEKQYFWHFHPNSDEIFLGIEGIVVLEVENQRIELGPGQLCTVPQGVRHRTGPAGRYSVNLTFERGDIETVPVDEHDIVPIE